jgi:orotate phosphoribosyltransferase
MTTTRQDEIRDKALKDLQQYEVLMINGHFDFGNGFHGRAYLNPHQLFRYPSTIWRFAQDLLDVIPPSIVDAAEVVAGPVTGGALLAHTMAGLLDSRRDLVDDIRNTGQTFARCAALVHAAAGTVLATCEIYDRLEATVDLGVPNIALAGYRAPENYAAESCPLCQAGEAITSF